jgi:hypothetical protein
MMLNFKMSLSFNDVVILNIPGNIGTVHGYIHVQLACVYTVTWYMCTKLSTVVYSSTVESLPSRTTCTRTDLQY